MIADGTEREGPVVLQKSLYVGEGGYQIPGGRPSGGFIEGPIKYEIFNFQLRPVNV